MNRQRSAASSELPAPDADATEHSRQVSEALQAQLQARGGWLDFSAFMELALYAPGLGYYSAGAAKFGAAGDFITAPELGPYLASCIAQAAQPIFAALPRPAVLELGAGTGALAADLLTACAALDALPDEYLILEVSAELRARQQHTLNELVPQLSHRVRWLDSLPPGFQGLILANEVMDALPVSRWIMTEAGPRPLGVAMDGENFCWATAEADVDARLLARLAAEPALDPGFRSEFCPGLDAWLHSLADCLDQGAVLLGDYGCARRDYYRPGRQDGTLICHYRHHAHADPFWLPGLQDLSAWVDFTAVAEAITAAGLRLDYYTTQAHFMLANGLAESMRAPADPLENARQSASLRQLLLPGEMGENFKFLLCSRGLELASPPLLRDLAHQL